MNKNKLKRSILKKETVEILKIIFLLVVLTIMIVSALYGIFTGITDDNYYLWSMRGGFKFDIRILAVIFFTVFPVVFVVFLGEVVFKKRK